MNLSNFQRHSLLQFLNIVNGVGFAVLLSSHAKSIAMMQGFREHEVGFLLLDLD